MKPSLFFRLFNIFMVCVVLTTSTGFGLVEHTCHVRNKKKVTLVSFEEKQCPACVKKDAKASTAVVLKKQKCCEEETRYEHVPYTSSLTKLAAKFVKMVVEFTASFSYFLFQLLASSVKSFIFGSSSTHAAVPLSGRALLSFVQSFQI